MKQTAVEWQHIELSKFLYGKSEFTDANDILIKAKEMEKEQMIDFAFNFYYDFCNKTSVPFNLISENRINAEEYYNETFNTEEPEFMQINQDNPVTKGSTALVRTFNTKEK
jgi:hypothetical protein